MVSFKEEPLLNTGKKRQYNRRGKRERERERERELVPLPKQLILVE